MYHKEKWEDQGRSRREKLGYCQQSTLGNSEGYSRLGGEETGQLLQDGQSYKKSKSRSKNLMKKKTMKGRLKHIWEDLGHGEYEYDYEALYEFL